MKDIIEKLEKLQKDVVDLQDFAIRSKNFSSNIEAAAFKNIEEGIVKNLHKANKEQLRVMLNSWKFRYYTEFNKDKSLIVKELRNNRLKSILNGEEEK
jgi:thermostable 8-oxoguanine DNA glycosylase